MTDDTQSDTLQTGKDYWISKPVLITNKEQNTSSNTLHLGWKINNDKLVKKFILERQENINQDWKKIGEFNKSTRSFTDTGLDPQKFYAYRIKTLSSNYSDKLNLAYRAFYKKLTTFEGHSNKISDLDFSPNGKYLASSSNYALGYGDGFANIWDLESYQLYKKIDSREESITSLHFSNNGTMLATGSWFDGTVKIFEFPSGKLLTHIDRVDAYDVKFSPDNQFIAATGGFGDVRKWDVETGDLMFHYEGHGSPSSTPHTLAYNPDGSDITVDDKGFVVLDAQTGEKIKKLDTFYGYDSHPNNINYSSDGNKLTYTKYSLTVYDTNDWSQTFVVPRQGINIDNRHGKSYPQFLPNNNAVVAAAISGKINLRNIDTGEILNRFNPRKEITYFTYSPDGSQIAVGFGDNTIELWTETSTKGWKRLIPYEWAE